MRKGSAWEEFEEDGRKTSHLFSFIMATAG